MARRRDGNCLPPKRQRLSPALQHRVVRYFRTLSRLPRLTIWAFKPKRFTLKRPEPIAMTADPLHAKYTPSSLGMLMDTALLRRAFEDGLGTRQAAAHDAAEATGVESALWRRCWDYVTPAAAHGPRL